MSHYFFEPNVSILIEEERRKQEAFEQVEKIIFEHSLAGRKAFNDYLNRIALTFRLR